MELTFITIHDLTHEARVLFASLSISDVLGWIPEEVAGKSGFEFFHPEEAPFARSVYGRGVQLDRAAVLHYCSLRARDGSWVSCECAFTIVYNVMVVSISVYKRGRKSDQRAIDAPTVRKLFAASPRDPRYHMLAHLSTKFTIPSVRAINEPRAALILNRFTRTLSVLYATDAVATILGVPATELTGTSFYECIQEDCLQDAINCLERAKQNDSIAYLRFWFRDPRYHNVSRSPSPDSFDEKQASEMRMDIDGELPDVAPTSAVEEPPSTNTNGGYSNHDSPHSNTDRSASRPSLTRSAGDRASQHSPDDADREDSPIPHGHHQSSEESIFDHQRRPGSDPSSEPSSVSSDEPPTSRAPPVELEAVISCTSDGLVVVIRKAKAIMPVTFRQPVQHPYGHGLFASPWATTPLLPPPTIFNQGFNPGLASSQMMKSIEECACFAWSLGSVNGSLLEHASGRAYGEAAPVELNLWDPVNGLPGVHVPSSRPADNLLPLPSSNPSSASPLPAPYGPAPAPQQVNRPLDSFDSELPKRGPRLRPLVHREVTNASNAADSSYANHSMSTGQNNLSSRLDGLADAVPPSDRCSDQNANEQLAPQAPKLASSNGGHYDVDMID